MDQETKIKLICLAVLFLASFLLSLGIDPLVKSNYDAYRSSLLTTDHKLKALEDSIPTDKTPHHLLMKREVSKDSTEPPTLTTPSLTQNEQTTEPLEKSHSSKLVSNDFKKILDPVMLHQDKVAYPSCDFLSEPVSVHAPTQRHCVLGPSSSHSTAINVTVYKYDPSPWTSDACHCYGSKTIKTCEEGFFGGKTETQKTELLLVTKDQCIQLCSKVDSSGHYVSGRVGGWDCDWMSTNSETYEVFHARKTVISATRDQKNIIPPGNSELPCSISSDECSMSDGSILVGYEFPESKSCRMIPWQSLVCNHLIEEYADHVLCPHVGLSFTITGIEGLHGHYISCNGNTLVVTDQKEVIKFGFTNTNLSHAIPEKWTPDLDTSSDLSAAGDQFVVDMLRKYSLEASSQEAIQLCNSHNDRVRIAHSVAKTDSRSAVRILMRRSDITGYLQSNIITYNVCKQFKILEWMSPKNGTCYERWPVSVTSLDQSINTTLYFDPISTELFKDPKEHTCTKRESFWIPYGNSTYVDLNNPYHLISSEDDDINVHGLDFHELIINRSSLYSASEVTRPDSLIMVMDSTKEYISQMEDDLYGTSSIRDYGVNRKNTSDDPNKTTHLRNSLGMPTFSFFGIHIPTILSSLMTGLVVVLILFAVYKALGSIRSGQGDDSEEPKSYVRPSQMRKPSGKENPIALNDILVF